MSKTVENYHRIRALIPNHVMLLAVSKNHGIEKIQELYAEGQRDFGENKVQELLEKAEQLPKDIRWHLIGHLQRNKVRALLPAVSLIHSSDSERLFYELLKEAIRMDLQISVLIQVRIAAEETKFGMPAADVLPFIQSIFPKAEGRLKLKGLMGMGSFVSDSKQIHAEFSMLQELFQEVKATPGYEDIQILSMGMSQDWPLAVELGSTCVRIGSDIFGMR